MYLNYEKLDKTKDEKTFLKLDSLNVWPIKFDCWVMIASIRIWLSPSSSDWDILTSGKIKRL